MASEVYLTTSWDDGHPLDLRVADLLAKYGLPGTFYVPMRAESETMIVPQIRELCAVFEIGAHTLSHTVLTGADDNHAWQEIIGGRSWLQDSTGAVCAMFCPPRGKYASRHIGMVREAGYIGLRTVELLSPRLPCVTEGIAIMPTTCQAFPHHADAYGRNALRRHTFTGLWQYIRHGCPREWTTVAHLFLDHTVRAGGVFHLWGHSWELQETKQWERLEHVLRAMHDVVGDSALATTNGQLCARSISDIAVVGKAQRATSGQQ
jgi:peptidoglycan/xylan/chitin deacetylase (PgdA/CDA1 family)